MDTARNTADRSDTIAALKDQVRRFEGSKRLHDDVVVSTGCHDLDRLFPEGGIRRGSLVEWHGLGRGHGAGSLALIAARQACADGGALVVIDRQGTFYAPAALALGIDLDRLMIVRPSNGRDEVWAFDQSLRCEAVSAVWGNVEQLNAPSFRRLQLSVEEGNSIGFLVRPQEALRQPSWSNVRLLVEPQPPRSGFIAHFGEGEAPAEPNYLQTTARQEPRPPKYETASRETGLRFRVEVVRCHGGRAGSSGEFEIDETTGMIRTASQSSRGSRQLSAISFPPKKDNGFIPLSG